MTIFKCLKCSREYDDENLDDMLKGASVNKLFNAGRSKKPMVEVCVTIKCPACGNTVMMNDIQGELLFEL